MKIFHIVSNKEWGGGEQYVYDLSQHQQKDGIDVTIFCKPVEAIIQKYVEAGMKVVPLALGGALDVKSAWQMAKVIHATAGPCAIHAHNFKDAFTACYARWIKGTVLMMPFSSKNGSRRTVPLIRQVRVVMCRHLTRKGKNGLLYRWLYRHLDRLIFDSDLSKTVFLSTHPTIDAAKLGVIHTSIVVPEGFTTVDIRTRYHIPAENVIGMYHGRLDPEKGLDVLIDAVALLRDKPFRLVLVGRGSEDYTTHLKQVITEKRIADKVIFAGFIHPVLSYVAAADFGILASTVQEGCPLSPQEYMSQGHPVVVTNNGGQREYVVHEQNGLLVPPGDVQALAEAMGRLVEDTTLRQRLGQQAKADFDDHLYYAHYYEQIKRVYGL